MKPFTTATDGPAAPSATVPAWAIPLPPHYAVVGAPSAPRPATPSLRIPLPPDAPSPTHASTHPPVSVAALTDSPGLPRPALASTTLVDLALLHGKAKIIPTLAQDSNENSTEDDENVNDTLADLTPRPPDASTPSDNTCDAAHLHRRWQSLRADEQMDSGPDWESLAPDAQQSWQNRQDTARALMRVVPERAAIFPMLDQSIQITWASAARVTCAEIEPAGTIAMLDLRGRPNRATSRATLTDTTSAVAWLLQVRDHT